MLKLITSLLAITFPLTANSPAPEQKPTSETIIYCAGPLFNPYEREMMNDIAEVFEINGYQTFLPHRDGIEFSAVIDELIYAGISKKAACTMLERAIFDLDAYQVAMRCDAVVCSLNGRVPDEGAISECAIAWSFQKPIVYFKNDSRGLGCKKGEAGDNALVLGLSQFEVIENMEELPTALKRKWEHFPSAKTILHPEGPAHAQLERGAKIWELISKSKGSGNYMAKFSGLLCEFYSGDEGEK